MSSVLSSQVSESHAVKSGEVSVHKFRAVKDTIGSPSWVAESVEKPQNGIITVIQSKWVRICIFFLACFFTSAIYYGWQQYAQMLYQSGAYAWLCADDNPKCSEQRNAIADLYSIAAGCEYASAALGGLLLDHIGPRYSAAIGEVMWLAGTLLIAFASQSAPLYIFGMIILGSSVNVVCFPSLCTIETFPRYQGLMVGLVLSAQNAATMLPVVLLELWKMNERWTFRNIWLVYCTCIAIPITSLYLIALPGKRDFAEILKLQRIEVLALHEKMAITNTTEKQDLPKESMLLKDDASTVKSPSLVLSRNSEDGVENGDIVRIQASTASWSQFLSNLCTLDMGVMAFWFLVMMMQYAYYATVVRDAIGAEISDFVSYFMPSQAIWALLVGFACDILRTGYVMVIMCATLAIVYGLCLRPDIEWVQYLAAVILVITQAAIFEVKFTYVGEMFDPYNYGKLVGCLGILGGIGTFLNIPISRIATHKHVFLTYVISLPLLGLIALFLVFRQARGVTYKSLPEANKSEGDIEARFEVSVRE